MGKIYSRALGTQVPMVRYLPPPNSWTIPTDKGTNGHSALQLCVRGARGIDAIEVVPRRKNHGDFRRQPGQ